MTTTANAPLADLAPLLAEEPAVRAVVDRAPVVAVPDAARALFVAALALVTSRRPVVLAVPTGAEAERLVHDLARFLGPDAVELFPAWETLPFERVSPSLETMGRRLRVMWRLSSSASLAAGGDTPPAAARSDARSAAPSVGTAAPTCLPRSLRVGRLDPGTRGGATGSSRVGSQTAAIRRFLTQRRCAEARRKRVGAMSAGIRLAASGV